MQQIEEGFWQKNRVSKVDSVLDTARAIIEDVRKDGDKAIKAYTEKFDKIKLKHLAVSREEIEAAYDKVDAELVEELENAARNFGAGPVRTLFKVTLPLVAANLLVGGLFAFSFSMLEVSDSLVLAQKSVFYPITKALLDLSQILGCGPAAACAFGVWAMAFLALTLGAAGALLGRKIGAIFKF